LEQCGKDNTAAEAEAQPGDATMAWNYNHKVNYTYAHHGSQYVYAYLDGGLGWKRVKTGAADGVTNLFLLLTTAKANDRQVHVNLDAADMITHAYLV
jgi:hypothetical protein